MSQGESFDAFAGKIGATTAEITAWCMKHDDFERARLVGWSKQLSYWEKVGIGLATGMLKGSAEAWKMNMKQHFKWSDRQDLAVAHFDAYRARKLDWSETRQILMNDEFMDWLDNLGGKSGRATVSLPAADKRNEPEDPLA